MSTPIDKNSNTPQHDTILKDYVFKGLDKTINFQKKQFSQTKDIPNKKIYKFLFKCVKYALGDNESVFFEYYIDKLDSDKLNTLT